MKGAQCYELFGGIALKNHAFSFFIFFISIRLFAPAFIFLPVCLFLLFSTVAYAFESVACI